MTASLYTPAEAAAYLGCSLTTLKAHVRAGRLRYVAIGQGAVRKAKRFQAADLDALIETLTETAPCPSTSRRTPRTTATTSNAEVVDLRSRLVSEAGGTRSA